MSRVYQRGRALPIAGALLGLALAAAGCRRGAAPAPGGAETSPRRDPLAAFLASYSVELAGPLADGRLAGTRWSASGPRAVWLGPAAGEIGPLLASEGGASRVLATLDGGRSLIESAAANPAEAPTWRLAGPGAALRRLGPPPGELWRLLGAASGRRAVYLAARPAAGGIERLLELGAGGESRSLADAPSGMSFAAVAADGTRAVLWRRRDERAEELYLVDRGTGETTLLLAAEETGSYRALAFSADARRLLLLADDESDQPRAEWLELGSRARSAVTDSPCAVLGAAPGPDGSLALELGCAGRAELLWLDATGAERAAPPAPSGTRPVAAWPAPTGAPLLYAVAGARWPRELWRQSAGGEAEPLTYGLAAGIDAADLVDPEPLSLAAPDGALPAELWRPRRAPPGAPRPGLLWLESDARPVRWFEFVPLFQYLAQRGVAVVRLRPRGADGFGRRYRARADGRRGEVEPADVALGRSALVERGGADATRLALVGEGAWNGALAAALATRAEPAFALLIAIDPDPDPLAPRDAPADPAGVASASSARAGAPEDPALARRRAALRLGAAPARQPLRVVLDSTTPPGAAVRAALEAAGAAGGAALWFDLATPPLEAPRLDARLAALLDEQLRPLLAAPRSGTEAP